MNIKFKPDLLGLIKKLTNIFAAMHPKELSIFEYTYELANDRIARYPLEKRDESKLLIYQSGSIKEDIYLNLDTHLPGNSFLVFNKTKVVEARLLFSKPTGGMIEVFCLEPHEHYPDITTAMLQKQKVWWKCLIGGASKWKHGVILTKQVEGVIIEASIIDRNSETFTIEISWNNDDLTFAEVLHIAGAIPLPPYLNRNAEESDKERYQTIYAKEDGSVAAPTAGLHFTERLFDKLQEKNITSSFVTLHVGAGTFKPVKAEKMEAHEMHAEFIDVELSFIKTLIQNIDNPVVAIGTTSLRTIESLYWIGNKIRTAKYEVRIEELSVNQWDPYEIESDISAKDALQILLDWMQNKKIDRLITKTQIIIAPGYELKVAKGLITNFHQPQSTLLLLVAAIVGDDWKKIYDYAKENDFRFLSYGDGSLLWKK
jgi:S-adenosylmethionine:tRNA ribosyltransferase-isomerase